MNGFDNELYGPIIKVIGIGKGGLCALNKIIDAKLPGLDYIAFDKNGENLTDSKVSNNFVVADKSDDEIDNWLGNLLENTDLLFILADIGCEFASTYAERIATAAKRKNISLSVTIVSKNSGSKNSNSIEKLSEVSDSLIVIDNNGLIKDNQNEISIEKSYDLAAEKMKDAVEGISQIITVQDLIGVDFADVKNVLKDSKNIHFVSGCSENTEMAATKAKEELLKADANIIEKALITIKSGNEHLGLSELNKGLAIIRDIAKENSDIIFGINRCNEKLWQNQVKFSIVAVISRL